MSTTTTIDEIGFYTLTEQRCRTVGASAPLQRCELLLTDRCNFRCPYCRGAKSDGDLPLWSALKTISAWCSEGLQNIRFSGGEPTLYPGLFALVGACHRRGVKRIALSTNGSARRRKYEDLLSAGVNDFSVSLDACCASTGNAMAGKLGQWEAVVENIRYLAGRTYVTVGVVYDEKNAAELAGTVRLASSLGVADIRIIPTAQSARTNDDLASIPDSLLGKHPILRYRVDNARNGNQVRGLSDMDTDQCYLVLDDMAVSDNKHYPCIIYLREGGQPIGEMCSRYRSDRHEWFLWHDTHNDPICHANCLDVCVAHNNASASESQARAEANHNNERAQRGTLAERRGKE